MSGLFAAAFLRQQGWNIDVYERSPVELVGRGAGITTHPELLDALQKSGAGLEDLGLGQRACLMREGTFGHRSCKGTFTLAVATPVHYVLYRLRCPCQPE